uniref:RING-type domain-containing protein n=1 Tax=Kalanchoe fedtschenkoi TaxID=63787 RepID=A0A7N0R809_KALFE
MLSVILALFLPCVGMSAVFLIYLFVLWYVARREINALARSVKPQTKLGLSESDLKKLPTVTGKDLVLGTDCAVCLDEIRDEDAATMVPGCNHGFHKECAEMWLMRSGECPLCRAKIQPPPQDLASSSENSPV